MDTDIVKTRRERLRELITKRFGGRQSRLVEDTGINAGELSGLLRTKAFGEKKARALEDQLGLPAEWLDGKAKAPEAEHGELLELWEYLLPKQRQEFIDQMKPLADFNKEVRDQFVPRVVRVNDRRKRTVNFDAQDRRIKKENGDG